MLAVLDCFWYVLFFFLELACLLEEVPSAKSPLFHEVIVKDLVTLNKLIDTSKEKGTPTPGLECD